MKPCFLRPQAQEDRKNEVRHYRAEAGTQVAHRLVEALRQAQSELSRHPSIASLVLGPEFGLPGMRTWRISGFRSSLWYFERETLVDIARLVGNARRRPAWMCLRVRRPTPDAQRPIQPSTVCGLPQVPWPSATRWQTHSKSP